MSSLQQGSRASSSQTGSEDRPIRVPSLSPCTSPVKRDRSVSVELVSSSKKVRTNKGWQQKGGRPKDELAHSAIIPLEVPEGEPHAGEVRYYCVGSVRARALEGKDKGCQSDWSAVDPARIKRHAKDCAFVDEELREQIQRSLSKGSLTSKLNNITGPGKIGGSPSGKAGSTGVRAAGGWGASGSCNSTLEEFYPKRPKPLAETKARYDLAILRFIVCCGIPPDVLDSPWFKDMIQTFTGTTYDPPSSTRFLDNLLPTETEGAKSEILKLLRAQKHLSHSFDGWTSKGKQSIYTSTATLPDGRSYTLKGHEHTRESHTGEMIAKHQLEVRFISKI
jgi:hypothetical protein